MDWAPPRGAPSPGLVHTHDCGSESVHGLPTEEDTGDPNGEEQ